MIGFRWTEAGADAGVDGVENAADTLPLAVNAGGGVGLGGGSSGMLVREGGVSGAPNAASIGATASGRDVLPGSRGSPWLPAAGPGGSPGTCGVNRGENGGVRWRGVAACLLGGGGGAGDGATGVLDAAEGATGVRGAAAEDGGADARGDAAGVVSLRGTVGGHDGDEEAAGVFVRGATGLAAVGVATRPGAADTGAATACSSSPQLIAAPTGMSPPQTEQRARIDTLVILAGSRRKTDRHSGQETFI